MIYGDNVFVLHVGFGGVVFKYQWVVVGAGGTNVTLHGSKDFLTSSTFSETNLRRLRKVIVNIEHVDDYTGMIKYNCGGRGLTAGIKSQVQRLVEVLQAVPYLSRLQVHLIDGAISRVRFPSGRVHRVQDERNYEVSQTVLEPFGELAGVRWVDVTGCGEEFGRGLEGVMMAS